MTYEKKATPPSITKITNILSGLFTGYRSPYPIVVKVVKIK